MKMEDGSWCGMVLFWANALEKSVLLQFIGGKTLTITMIMKTKVALQHLKMYIDFNTYIKMEAKRDIEICLESMYWKSVKVCNSYPI